ncbi:MAG: DUF5916 domain-containing protein [Bacteroidia bacterium]|nr:DUF5916 domain-containing protein [Bacteroidia bacterium]
MRNISVIILLTVLPVIMFAQQAKKVAEASRTPSPPVIDGILNDQVWQNAKVISDFRQSDPRFDTDPSFKTEVRILYDDHAIYFGAMMYDPHPDSILHQLGNRDDANLNTDQFEFKFDTYHNQLDAYIFTVSAAGVQADSRACDATYNAVWESCTKINDQGWTAEIRVPYSAIRFPSNDEQTWGLQIFRVIRRSREQDQWSLEMKDIANAMTCWGVLKGISKIDAPVRLSLFPYLSVYGEHFPYNTKEISNYSGGFSGGLDLKYGLNESFTFDMTLLPDFSQVKSDDKIKNLTAFETVYPEQRPFFQEAVDLFEKGNLFYTRRIGGLPLLFDSVSSKLKDGEFIEKNPMQAKLLNAAKFSGRNKKGLAIGVFNAITDNTYAVIEDSTGNQHKVLSDPMTNYNIIVLDQALKYNSSVYLINTNVARTHGFNNANVTGTGLSLFDKKIHYQFSAGGAVSRIFHKTDSINVSSINTGTNYFVQLHKAFGQFRALLNHTVMDSCFNANDLGITLKNNYISDNLILQYNYYLPVWRFREQFNQLTISDEKRYTNKKVTGTDISIDSWGTFRNYLTISADAYYRPWEVLDYYEPRVSGRYYVSPGAFSCTAGFSSDYRKPFALDGQSSWTTAKRDDYNSFSATLAPIIRVSDKLLFKYSFNFTRSFNDQGYVTAVSNDSIIFGRRNLATWENILTGKFLFSNYLSLSLNIRQYWMSGVYKRFYLLKQDGYLDPDVNYSENANFSFNTFNIDLLFNWEFAPGSNLSVSYKNDVERDESSIINSFSGNFRHTINSPQTNSISVIFLYYLDYQELIRRKSGNRQ